ncbi:MAG: hypothetical protein LAT76_02670 [Schleiferiaceae bacterium]|nr:hypothetical protein [Schleiferiaceae bacterium]
MKNLLRVVEIMWLVIAAMSIVEVIKNWGGDQTRVLIFAAFFVMAVFMFFFRVKSRRKLSEKFEKKNNSAK